MNDPSPRTSSDWFPSYAPFLILLLCLAALGTAIHQKTARAVAPPIYDPMAYYTKGALVWREWSSGRLVNPLNVAPAVRPPGTMLLTSPLGFSPNFRWFFFRSVYFPIVVFAFAFWILAESQVRRARQRWANLIGALILISLPMFYQFERVPKVQSPYDWGYDWGYVDCFVAALSALAAALLFVSVRRLSAGLAGTGIVVGALTLFVKPVGLMLMPIFCFLWATELAGVYRPIPKNWRENLRLRRYSLRTVFLLVAVFGGATAAALESEYLSRTNLKFGYTAQQNLIGITKNLSLWNLAVFQIPIALGWHWLCALIVAVALVLGGIAVRMRRRSLQPEDFRFLGAAVVLIGGIVWWIELAGPSQMRYLYPFLTIFLVVLLPAVIAAADRVLPGWARRPLGVLCLMPVAVVVTLLIIDAPPMFAQQLMGVNLSTGQFRQEVEMGDLLADKATQQGRNLKVYIIPGDERGGVVEAEGIYRNLLHAEAPTFQTLRSQDWIQANMIRRVDFVQADFLVFYPIRDSDRLRDLLAQAVVGDPLIEADVFSAWLTQAAEGEGLQTVEESNLRLIKVVDRAKFDEAFGRFAAKHKWRDLFYTENNPPVILTQETLGTALAGSPSSTRDIHFGDQLVLRGALLVPKDDGLQMELFWESLAEQPLKYSVFVHLIDQSGAIVAQADYKQDPGSRTSPRVAKAGEIWRDIVPLSEDKLKAATRIGFGIWDPPGTFLKADRGDRDWDNRRLNLRLKKISSQPEAAGPPRYEGHLDHAGCDTITGWAWNEQAPDIPLEVRVLIDGNPLSTLTASQPREDLRTAGKGDGEHAFSMDAPTRFKDGLTHMIAAKVGKAQFELLDSPQRVTCR